MSGMFDKVFGAGGSEGQNTTVPAGANLGKVESVRFNHERGQVGLRIYFPTFNTGEWANYAILNKEGQVNKKLVNILTKMFNGIGLMVRTDENQGADLEAAFNALNGNHYIVSVSVNGNFRNYYFDSVAAPPSRSSAPVATEYAEPSDDDLPF